MVNLGVDLLNPKPGHPIGGAEQAGHGGTGPGEAGRERGGAVQPGHDLSFSTPRTEDDRLGRLCGSTSVLNPM